MSCGQDAVQHTVAIVSLCVCVCVLALNAHIMETCS